MNRDQPLKLPVFLGVGPPRTGTTWLHETLVGRANLPPANKEIKFFDRHYDLGLEWYAANFDQSSKLVTGEICPTYFASAAARERIAQSGLRNISLLEGDAQTYALEAGRFDLIASRFGVMFFSDPAAAFGNLRRAARPGGRLCFACWGALKENPQWLIPYRVALRHLGPPAEKCDCGRERWPDDVYT
ncbi:MAG: class I SAM-dependent methyltransferase, partial [Candidatus Binataceae bacterium]